MDFDRHSQDFVVRIEADDLAKFVKALRPQDRKWLASGLVKYVEPPASGELWREPGADQDADNGGDVRDRDGARDDDDLSRPVVPPRPAP